MIALFFSIDEQLFYEANFIIPLNDQKALKHGVMHVGKQEMPQIQLVLIP